MTDLYLGLMSGTSVDGIDVVIADLEAYPPTLLHAQTVAWATGLHERILATLENHDSLSLLEFGKLDAALGEAFADAALTAIKAARLTASDIRAIGSHGQTLFHAPGGAHGFSMQAGDPNRIAEKTGITTVADFRRRDIAAGGQGAPLVPAFHQALFQDTNVSRAILNIGGMANLTLLPRPPAQITGFDSGPGNVLLDAWHRKQRGSGMDKGGEWASSGRLNAGLLERLLQHDYFRQAPPKSTGRESFHLGWLEQVLARETQPIEAADVQRTLLEFTATSIRDALQDYCDSIDEVLVCGGGAHNTFLMQRLAKLLAPRSVDTTLVCGLHPDWVEALAFAWLARQRLSFNTANIPSVTGAARNVVLGAVYPGSGSSSR